MDSTITTHLIYHGARALMVPPKRDGKPGSHLAIKRVGTWTGREFPGYVTIAPTCWCHRGQACTIRLDGVSIEAVSA